MGLLSNRVHYIVLVELKIGKRRTVTRSSSSGCDGVMNIQASLYSSVDMEKPFTAVSGGSSAGNNLTAMKKTKTSQSKLDKKTSLKIAPGRLRCGHKLRTLNFKSGKKNKPVSLRLY